MCKILHFFHQYMMSCNYFWMLCEGLYLHTLIVVSVFAEGPKPSHVSPYSLTASNLPQTFSLFCSALLASGILTFMCFVF